MDADGRLVGVSIPHAVHITNGGRHGFDVTRFKAALLSAGLPPALWRFGKVLAQLSAAQHADHAPHGVVVAGGGLAWAPHKTHH